MPKPSSQSTVSAVIAASDEEQMIESCLNLLGFTDEIVVVIDSRSTDRTEAIAKRYTKKVYRRKLESFAKQKNYGIGKATGKWILIIDADERVTPALAAEIKTVLNDPGDRVGFRIGFRNFFLGKEIKHGGWDERHLRLIKRSQARYSGDVHETLSLDGPTGELSERIWHFTHRDIQSMVRKTLRYGEFHVQEMTAEGHPAVTTRSLFTVPAKMLWYRLIRHRGYKDGIEGVIESMYQAFSYFLIYVMLWQYQRKPSLGDRYEKFERMARSHKL